MCLDATLDSTGLMVLETTRATQKMRGVAWGLCSGDEIYMLDMQIETSWLHECQTGALSPELAPLYLKKII